MSINLIHQPILLAMFLSSPIRNLFHKPQDILRISWSQFHKIILNLLHTISSRLYNQIIQIIKILIQSCRINITSLRNSLNTNTIKPIIAITSETLFHYFNFSCLTSLLVNSTHLKLL